MTVLAQAGGAGTAKTRSSEVRSKATVDPAVGSRDDSGRDRPGVESTSRFVPMCRSWQFQSRSSKEWALGMFLAADIISMAGFHQHFDEFCDQHEDRYAKRSVRFRLERIEHGGGILHVWGLSPRRRPSQVYKSRLRARLLRTVQLEGILFEPLMHSRSGLQSHEVPRVCRQGAHGSPLLQSDAGQCSGSDSVRLLSTIA